MKSTGVASLLYASPSSEIMSGSERDGPAACGDAHASSVGETNDASVSDDAPNAQCISDESGAKLEPYTRSDAGASPGANRGATRHTCGSCAAS